MVTYAPSYGKQEISPIGTSGDGSDLESPSMAELPRIPLPETVWKVLGGWDGDLRSELWKARDIPDRNLRGRLRSRVPFHGRTSENTPSRDCLESARRV